MHKLFSVYFVKPLHVSGVTTAHHQEAYRKPPDDGPWLRSQPNQDSRQSIGTNCCRLTVCLLMMGCGYARNM